MKARIVRVMALFAGACSKPTPTRFTTGGDEGAMDNGLTFTDLRLYRVVNGDRQEFASADLKVTSGEWHTLEVTAQGSKLEVSWNGRTVIQANDTTFAKGKIGLWTKADSVTAFDDLEAVAR